MLLKKEFLMRFNFVRTIIQYHIISGKFLNELFDNRFSKHDHFALSQTLEAVLKQHSAVLPLNSNS